MKGLFLSLLVSDTTPKHGGSFELDVAGHVEKSEVPNTHQLSRAALRPRTWDAEAAYTEDGIRSDTEPSKGIRSASPKLILEQRALCLSWVLLPSMLCWRQTHQHCLGTR